MSGTVSPGQAAEQQAGAAMTAEARSTRRAGRRRWVTAGAAVVVVAAGVVVAGVSGAFGRPGHSSAGSDYHTVAATVTRQSATSQTQVDATLGDAGSYSVVNQATGTITALPAAGQVVQAGRRLNGHRPSAITTNGSAAAAGQRRGRQANYAAWTAHRSPPRPRRSGTPGRRTTRHPQGHQQVKEAEEHEC